MEKHNQYGEQGNLKEFQEYLEKTYNGHYGNSDKRSGQVIDSIIEAGHGEGFCVGNIIKYASRYGKKNGKNVNDLHKVIHYTLLLKHVRDREMKND